MRDDGEQRLQEAVARWRRGGRKPAGPLNIQPTTALEALLLERIADLEEAIEKLEGRINWMLLTIIGACLVFIIETLLTG
jgi:hypothetical protein